MLSSGGRIKDLPNARNLLENVIYNFGLKIQPRPNLFCNGKHISWTPCTPKIGLLNAPNRIYLNSKYPSNHLRRHKKIKITEQNSPTYALTWFSTFASIRKTWNLAKEGKQINKHFESFVCIKTWVFSQKLHHKVKPAGTRTTYCALNKVSDWG